MTNKRIPASVRLGAILAEVENNGHASVTEIADRLGVSDMTVRRDMDKLVAGKMADFTVLEADPFDVEPEALNEIPIWGTMFEGRLHPISGR